MLSVIEKEQNTETKNSMIFFVSQIDRDMINFRFQTILSFTSIICTALEENRVEWMNVDTTNAMRKQYILNSVSMSSLPVAAGQPVI